MKMTKIPLSVIFEVSILMMMMTLVLWCYYDYEDIGSKFIYYDDNDISNMIMISIIMLWYYSRSTIRQY